MGRSHKPSGLVQAHNNRYFRKTPEQGSNGYCPESPVHSHWWYIEAPTQEYSTGTCRYCGATRLFENKLDLAASETFGKTAFDEEDLYG